MYAAIIVKVDAKTRSTTSLNDLLRAWLKRIRGGGES